MPSGTVIVICQSGGKFTSASDGSLLYTGGDAHAIGVSHETKFDELKLEMAEMCKCDSNSMVIKYFLPNNKRTLISVSSDKDIQRMIDFHEDATTVDVYIMKNEDLMIEATNMPGSRSSRTTLSEQPHTPLNATHVSSIPEDVDQPAPILTVAADVGYIDHPKRAKLWENCITGLHQQFNNVGEVRDAFRKYSIAQGFTIKFKKNDCTRVSAKCKVEGCPWRVYASRLSTTQLFRIKRLNDTHTCGAGTNSANRSQASKKVVASIVKEKLCYTPNVRPKEIANQIRQEFGIELGYSQARRWMEAAAEELQGAYKEAYNQLPWLCEKIVETNPGSVVTLITREDLSFHCFFAAFYASIHGFRNGCRPLLFLDTMTLESKYQSELLTATALDGNYGIFPVAFAVVDVVNYDNWHWFLVQLKSALAIFDPITFVTDRQLGLKDSISSVFENSYHAYCLHHLSEELKNSLKDPCTEEVVNVIITHLYDAAYAGSLDEFLKSVAQIRSISPEAYQWIERSEPKHWANSHFEGSRYNHVTSSIAELFYSWVTELPLLPVVQVIDTIRHKMMELIYTRKVDSDQWSTRLTPSLEDKLQKEILKAQSLQVVLSSEGSFNVQDCYGRITAVNIDAWQCDCREWQINGLPCFHAVAVLQHCNRDVYDHCSKYYTIEVFRLTYSESIKPVPNIDKPVHGESSPVQIHPPPLRHVAGPLKKRRIRSKGVVKRPLHCSNCKGKGHNRLSCQFAS